MLPLTLGMLVAGPTSGYLSDRFGARWFATGGMLGSALSFFLLTLLPIDFPFWPFALVLALIGVSMGMFASPNRAAVMNSLPPQHRGAGGGMNQTFQNSAQVLSIGIFFTLMILGLASDLPHTLSLGPAGARRLGGRGAAAPSHTPPVSMLFAAFLGYNPIEHLLGRARARRAFGGQPRGADRALVLPAPDLRRRFSTGLHEAFLFAIVACLIAAAASLLRGGKFHYVEPAPTPGEQRQRRRWQRRRRRTASTRRERARATTAEEQHAR